MIFARSKLALISFSFFILGIFIASQIEFVIAKNSFFLFCLVLMSLVIFFLKKHNSKIMLFSLFLFFFFLGLWRYSIALPVYDNEQIYFYNEKGITILEARIFSEVILSSNKQKFKVKVKKIIENKKEKKGFGKVLIYADIYPKYQYGDVVRLDCKLKKVPILDDFDYARYLAKEDIYSICYYPKIEKIADEENFVVKYVFILKQKVSQIIEKGLNRPASDILKSILLADKSGLSLDMKERFSKAGVSHIMAISGLHISIISAILMMIFLELGMWRKQAFFFTFIFLVFYLFLILFPASAVRAMIMGFVLLYGLNIGRLSKPMNAIFLAAFLLLITNPFLLRDDLGFQLSFLAVFGIIFIFPVIRKYSISFKSKILCFFQDIFLVSISAQLATLVIVFYNFKTISFFSPLVNVLVIWLMPFLILISFLAIILSFIFPVISIYFFYPVQLMVQYIIEIVYFFS